MSLKAHRIHLTNYRNHSIAEIELGWEMTVLLGPNGAGKTNILEALLLLTTGRLLRGGTAAEVVGWGATEARAELHCTEHEHPQDPSTHAARIVAARIAATGTREFSVNGHVRRRRADVFGQLPAVVFSPEDLSLAKGPAEARRTALDALGEQISATYGSLRRDYDKILRQRNALLKEGAPYGLIEAWTARLVDVGSRLTAHRAGLLTQVAEGACAAYARISPREVLDVLYEPSWSSERVHPTEKPSQGDVARDMESELRRREEEERARGYTLVGPHRDDIIFEIDGHDARMYGSQGQQRSVALAWKLAEVDAVRRIAKGEPLLLLDDVMSELDEGRRHELAELVRGQVQTVVTTTNLHYFEESFLEGARVVRL